MDIKKVTKMFRGRVDIRSYEVGKYIKKGGVKIEHDGQYMILSPDQLKKGEVMTKNLKSKFNATKPMTFTHTFGNPLMKIKVN